jgi:uncharacterized protein
MNTSDLDRKYGRLVEALKKLDSLLVAFSGGVDSTLLLAVARDVLAERVVAVTVESPLHPSRERNQARRLARRLGVTHLLLQSETIGPTEFLANPKDRCYVCKQHLFRTLRPMAVDRGIHHIAHGANVDDLGDYRPGYAAALEMGIEAPLIDAGLTKTDIRTLSRRMGLETWDKPAMACLVTRIPYGTPVTLERLRQVERAEEALFDLGFGSCRVRYHGEVARIEVTPADIPRFLEVGLRRTVADKLRAVGFLHVALDLEGYRQGSMNLSLTVDLGNNACPR